MKDKMWSEHDLRKRDEIAARAAESIATTKHPRQQLNWYIRDLLKYEIIPNYVFDDWTDDEIRQLAIQDLNPPKRLSKAANYDDYNKFPSLSVEQCIMLLIDVKSGTPIRTQAEKDQHDRVINLAASYCRDRREPFTDDHTESIDTYQIAPHKFIAWANSSVGATIPKEWKPAVSVVNPAKKHRHKKSKKLRDSCVTELREAAVKLCAKKARQDIADKYITVENISIELYEDGKFKNGDPFSDQWQRPETIRGHLKGKNNPKRHDLYRQAKPDKPHPFN